MNTKTVRSLLENSVDVLSFRNKVYTAKKSYYWGATQDGSAFRDKIQKLIPKARVVDYGNHWHSFVGGAKPGSSQDSYYYCKFEIKE